MKFLFVHNRYGKPSGEEMMLGKIIELLRSRGHSVDTFFADSAALQGVSGKLTAATSGLRSVSSIRALRARIQQIRPDLVQVQNLYPMISPAVLPIIRTLQVPIVMRLSNYRLVCPNGLFLSHGQVCEACSGGREWHCITKNCEDSIFKSTAYAARNAWARQRGYYRKNITRYYAQTNFQRSVLVREGFQADQIDVIPNMTDTPTNKSDSVPGDYVGFVGRLSTEKGVETLIQAAQHCPDIPIHLAGDPGPWAQRRDLPSNVTLLGHLTGEELDAFYRNAVLIAVPSLWYEGFPSVIIEAMRHSRPVIVSDIGGLPEIIAPGITGVTFPPGDAEALSQAIVSLWTDPTARRTMGDAGFTRVKDRFSQARYYEQLMACYKRALA